MKKNNSRGIYRSLALWSLVGLAVLVAGVLTLNKNYNNKESTDEAVTSFAKTNSTKSDFLESDAVEASPRVSEDSDNTPEIENGKVTQQEQMISRIVTSGRPIHDITEDLLKLLPVTDGAEQIMVASHLSNLAEGDQINRLVGILSIPNLNDEAKEEIFNTIYDAEPKQVASMLIQVIEDGVVDYTDEAQKGLSILLQADHGTDVAAWKSELSNSDFFLEADLNKE